MFTVWYRISCSFLVIITHSCCALVCYYHQKAHSIPYHTVNTSNSVINPLVILVPVVQFTISWFLELHYRNLSADVFKHWGEWTNEKPEKLNLWQHAHWKVCWRCLISRCFIQSRLISTKNKILLYVWNRCSVPKCFPYRCLVARWFAPVFCSANIDCNMNKLYGIVFLFLIVLYSRLSWLQTWTGSELNIELRVQKWMFKVLPVNPREWY